MLISKALFNFMIYMLIFFVTMPYFSTASAFNTNTIILAENLNMLDLNGTEKNKPEISENTKTQNLNEGKPSLPSIEMSEVNKERKEKIRLLLTKAGQGDALSQYELGNILYYGWYGVQTDRKKGISYYEKAAENGNAKAQYAFATLYYTYTYDGIPKDIKKAQYWLEKAAEQGYAKAQTSLGQMYQSHYFSIPPDFIPPDFEKATYWLEKAAKQGSSWALTSLRIVPGPKPGYSRAATKVESKAFFMAYQEEMRLLSIQAEQGDILAQYELAVRYNHPQDDEKKALYWFEKAANEGHAKAMYEMSEMYNYGNSAVKKDPKKRVDYLEQAAKQGHIGSQVELGFIYLKGDKGFSQDFAKAAQYFGQAAKQGHNEAKDELGIMYAEGKSFPKNLEQAKYYFMKLSKDFKLLGKQTAKYLNAKEKANQGDIRAQYRLANMYYGGELSVPQDLKKARHWFAEIAKNYEEALKQEEEFSAILAQVTLAHMYMDGKGGDKDIKKAIYWFEQADSHEDVSAPYYLGRIYLGYANKETQDITKAKDYFIKAAKSSIAFAGFSWVELGLIYEFGKGTIAQDYKKARKYYEQAANYDFAQGQFNLGSLYYDGKGVKKDYKNAFSWWEKSAKQGHTRSQFNLALMYSKGEGVAKNLQKSTFWFRKAAHQGHVGAIYGLGWALEYGKGVAQNIPHAYGYVLILLRLDPDDEHFKNLEKLKTHLLDEYQMSPKQIKEAEAFAVKVWQDIESSSYIINHQH